jgi:hypothetical protein
MLMAYSHGTLLQKIYLPFKIAKISIKIYLKNLFMNIMQNN